LHNSEGFPPVILITAFGDEKTHEQAYLFGAAAVFDKPFDIEDLVTKVQEIAPSY
jgi:CheY-like chemotaxis protein